MQPGHDIGKPTIVSRLLVRSIWLALALGLCGCATSNKFKPNELPVSWQARPTSNVRTIGLTKLANNGVPMDQIAPGDVIEVNLAAGLGADDSVEFSARVLENGQAILPHIGPVDLAGLTLEQAESAIKVACIQGQYYRDPHVVVTMKQRKEVLVTVVGAVEEEGNYYLRSGSAGLLSAISLAGGFSEDAGTDVTIRRPPQAKRGPLVAQGESGSGHTLVAHEVPVQTGGSSTIKINLASLNETEAENLELVDGSVVMVERRDPLPLNVTGLVRKPDVYEYPLGKDMHVLDAIAMAGGESSLVANKVFVIRRRAEQTEPVVIEVSLRKAKRSGQDNILLEPGDVVSVEQTPSTVVLEAIRLVGFGLSGRVF